MRIGVPKEIKNNEFRVGMIPAAVRELTARGHRVFVDGKNFGPDPRVVVLACGAHVVKIGHDGRDQPLTIPCGGRVEASYP